MTCDRIHPLLSAYLDGELAPAQQAEVDAHLADCPDCARVLDDYRALGQEVRALPDVPPPTGMRQVFAARLQRLRASPFLGMHLNLRRGLSAALFVTALVALAVGVHAILQHMQPVDQEVGIVTSYPAAGETGVPVNANLTLTFARPMDRASVEGAVSMAPEADLAFAWEGETMTLVPFDDWRPSTTYTLTVATTARAADGAPLAEPFVLSFTTSEESSTTGEGLNPIGHFGVVWRAELGGPAGPLGYATDVAQELWCATQPFEHGRMIWVDQLQEDRVYVLAYGEDETSGTWRWFTDTFREGDAESEGLTPPEGLLEPIRGFGKVWRKKLGGPDAVIGWAVAPEQGYVGETQPFEHGLMLWSPLDGITYVLWNDGSWAAYPLPE